MRSLGIVVKSHEQMCASHSFVRKKHVVILPALLSGTICDGFVNPDQVVDLRLQAVAIEIGAVIAVVNARVTFGGEDISVGEDFIVNDPVVGKEIGVVVFDKCDGPFPERFLPIPRGRDRTC